MTERANPRRLQQRLTRRALEQATGKRQSWKATKKWLKRMARKAE
jgi:hypothetical protein